MKRPSPAPFVLLIGFLVLLYNGGSRFTMGLMLKPMADELDWGRATLSLTVTLFMVISALALPISGRLVDRFNMWMMLSLAILLAGGSIALMSIVQTPFEALFFYGILFAIASAGTSITPIGVIVSRWFPKHIGMANSIAISGMGVGQLIVILIMTQQLESIGWRNAFLLLGAMGVVLLLPLVLFSFLPTAQLHPAKATRDTHGTDNRLADVMKSRYLWQLLAIYAVCGFQDFFVATHVVAFARDNGVESLLAGNLYAFMGLLGLAGVLATGYLSDRFGPVRPTMACFILRILIFLLVLVSNAQPAIALFALLYGLTFWITAPLTIVFTRQRFGFSNLGTLTGVVTMVHHGAGGLGAYVGGYVFDLQGEYNTVFWLMLFLSLAALLLTATLSKRKT